MTKNFPGTRIPLFRMMACLRYAFFYYFKTNSTSEFENILHEKAKFSLSEERAIIKHFRNEIYPVDKVLAKWILSLGVERYFLKTELKELEKTHTITKKQKLNVK